VQYGPGGSAFAVYMTPYPLRPYQRTAEVLNERAGLVISPGTLQRTVRMAAARLEAPVIAIRDALVAAPVAHADEVKARHFQRVDGRFHRRMTAAQTDELGIAFAGLIGRGALALFRQGPGRDVLGARAGWPGCKIPGPG